jgi:large subunit ribosomal protein LP2
LFVLLRVSQCVLGGNASPAKGDVEKILASVGAEADGDKLTKLMSELEGKNIEELIAAGTEKLASVPSGGAVASSGAASGGAAAAEEEKKEESEEESDDDMGFSLFD